MAPYLRISTADVLNYAPTKLSPLGVSGPIIYGSLGPNGTSIGPAVLAGLTVVTNRHTDRPRYFDKVSPRGRQDDMPPADGSSTVANIAADLRPSADGSAVRTSLVAGGG